MQEPIPLNLPGHPFKLLRRANGLFVYDELRKKYLKLTPEEWVRQHWIHYLIREKEVPKNLIQSEGGLMLNTLQKRTDLVLFARDGKRLCIGEFKAPHIKISQSVFDQISRYNIVHRVPYLLVSNGLQHYYCKINFEEQSYSFMEELPSYGELSGSLNP